VPIALVLALTACGGTTGPSTTAGGETGTVIAVVDGDSLRIALADGTTEVRLTGINAPEVGECWADESRSALDQLVGPRATIHGEGRDQYGRRLATVVVDGMDVNLEMVRLGHAVALSDGGDTLISAEDSAATQRRGLWSATACGPAVDSGLAVVQIVADPPGPDDADLAGEYVVLANDGPTADLTGWVLRDESSVHRFRFPDGFRLGAGESVVVRTGCGNDSPTELHWCAGGPVWNNGGDMALLLDESGNVAVRVRY